MKPDASLHNPSPDYLRALVERSGLSRRDVVKLQDGSEARIRSYATQYARLGFHCSADFTASWNAECARWDFFKATLERFA